MENIDLVAKAMRDIVFLEVAGIRPVVVHGGGKAISAAMQKAGLAAEFIGGLRVTTPEAIAIVEQTLTHSINPKLVSMIEEFGGLASGLSGRLIFEAQRMQAQDPDTGMWHSLGRVGEVCSCQLEAVNQALDQGKVPVISPLANEVTTGKPLNVNADLAAAALAKALHVTKLIYLSDVPGLLEDPSHSHTLIPSLTPSHAHQLIKQGVIRGGMLPKVRSALDTLQNGVEKVHFIDGRKPHSLLLEIFTRTGIGTEVIAS